MSKTVYVRQGSWSKVSCSEWATASELSRVQRARKRIVEGWTAGWWRSHGQKCQLRLIRDGVAMMVACVPGGHLHGLRAARKEGEEDEESSAGAGKSVCRVVLHVMISGRHLPARPLSDTCNQPERVSSSDNGLSTVCLERTTRSLVLMDERSHSLARCRHSSSPRPAMKNTRYTCLQYTAY